MFLAEAFESEIGGVTLWSTTINEPHSIKNITQQIGHVQWPDKHEKCAALMTTLKHQTNYG